MVTEVTPAQSASRRMSVEREGEVLAAALVLLAEHGYEALTMDAVAAAAHTSKATIYRQWQGKPGLVAAALSQCHPWPQAVNTGSLRGDLVALIQASRPAKDEVVSLLPVLAHAVSHDPELGDLLRAALFGPGREAFAAVLAWAVSRGEVRADHPLLDQLDSLLLSAAVGRQLVDGVMPDETYLIGLVDRVIVPLLVEDTPAHSSSSSLPPRPLAEGSSTPLSISTATPIPAPIPRTENS